VEREKVNSSQQEAKAPPKGGAKKKNTFAKELFSGTMITEKLILKNLGFVLFLTFLGAVYIGNRFRAEKINRQLNELTVEVTDLRAQSLFISADLMEASRQSEVYSLVRERGLGLEELKAPPFKIIDE